MNIQKKIRQTQRQLICEINLDQEYLKRVPLQRSLWGLLLLKMPRKGSKNLHPRPLLRLRALGEAPADTNETELKIIIPVGERERKREREAALVGIA